jgi:hypothetical protein
MRSVSPSRRHSQKEFKPHLYKTQFYTPCIHMMQQSSLISINGIFSQQWYLKTKVLSHKLTHGRTLTHHSPLTIPYTQRATTAWAGICVESVRSVSEQWETYSALSTNTSELHPVMLLLYFVVTHSLKQITESCLDSLVLESLILWSWTVTICTTYFNIHWLCILYWWV